MTTGWNRAGRLVGLARRLFGPSSSRDGSRTKEELNAILATHMLPIYITTFLALRKKRVDGPIWWNAITNERDEYCFVCLETQREDASEQAQEQPSEI